MKYMIFTATADAQMSQTQIDEFFRKKNIISENAKLIKTECQKSQYSKNEYVLCGHYQE